MPTRADARLPLVLLCVCPACAPRVEKTDVKGTGRYLTRGRMGDGTRRGDGNAGGRGQVLRGVPRAVITSQEQTPHFWTWLCFVNGICPCPAL